MEVIQNHDESHVDDLIKQRRDESDARDIIKEVERLASFEGQHRYRWIWELLQNARDEAGSGVEIICKMDQGNFTFMHNGQPFKTEHLIALTLRSSTKPLDGTQGNAGKFGTGFVTTHLLNKFVTIKGVHENKDGRRRFLHVIDRNSTELDKMMNSLSESIQSIRNIDRSHFDNNIDPWNIFHYALTGSSAEIAGGGLEQLKKNLAFSLLVNEKTIKSVTVHDREIISSLRISKSDNVLGTISFLHLINDNDLDATDGLLYRAYGKLIIASPAKRFNDHFELLPLHGVARLVKELPLIGTEEFVTPNIIQHENFMPAEPRDGIRTKMAKDINGEPDRIAEKNREAFKDYIDYFPDFLQQLVDSKVHKLHLLCDTGLPTDADKYYGRDWLMTEIQGKIRATLLAHELVRTVSGATIRIQDAYFAKADDVLRPLMHELLAELFPEKTPSFESFQDWNAIIIRDAENWPAGIMLDITDLVKIIDNKEVLTMRLTTPESLIEWLQKLISFLEISKNERLGLEHPLYLSQSGIFRRQNDIFHEVDLDPQFKKIAANLGRNVADELLPAGFKASFVLNFNVKEFLNDINNTIGQLKFSDIPEEKIQGVIDICSTFETAKAPRRDAWYDLLARLFPEKVSAKITVELKEDYSWDSAEKWSLKYIALLIERATNLETFSSTYFKPDYDVYRWLNDFIAFVFRNDDNRLVLEQRIILTQDGFFKRYDDALCREDRPVDFLPELKKAFKEHCGQGDPAAFLIDTNIENINLRQTDIEILSRPIDLIFKDPATEEQVKEGLRYHELFMTLKDLTEEEKWADRFPFFTDRQPILFIKAFGVGSRVGRLLKIKKPVEEMEKLAALSLSADQLKQLDDAAKLIGNTQSLIDQANQMAIVAEENRWRKAVGDAAEEAFLEALAKAHPDFSQPDNPDNGKDFVIKIGSLSYSIEIKSAIVGKESVKMSLRQGDDAVTESSHYALCVISRPFGTFTDATHFKKNALFVTNIGEQIGDKIRVWRNGIAVTSTNEDVCVELDSRSGYVNIRKHIWESGVKYDEFIKMLKNYFKIPAAEVRDTE
jgi:hypothetical protein